MTFEKNGSSESDNTSSKKMPVIYRNNGVWYMGKVGSERETHLSPRGRFESRSANAAAAAAAERLMESGSVGFVALGGAAGGGAAGWGAVALSFLARASAIARAVDAA